jgi:hypothetical protein
MGIVLDNDNNYLNTILDILIVFLLGSSLLFFAYIIKHNNKFMVVYVSIIVILVILYNMIYMNSHVPKKSKEKNNYNVLTFVNIYTMILMILLSGMSYYIITEVEAAAANK